MSAAIEQYVMTEAEAHRVTEDIRHNAKSFSEYRARMMQAVERAKAGSAHIALGYRSWTAYLSEVLGEEPMRLARSERQDMVRMLSDEGMSTRAIAPIVGASHETVAQDRTAGVRNLTPNPAPEFVDTRTGEIHEKSAPGKTPEKITGADGKQYPKPASVVKPEPAAPRRRPLPDAFFEAVYDLGRKVERLRRLVEDDRFPQNREQVARKHANDLSQSADVLADVLRNITTDRKADQE